MLTLAFGLVGLILSLFHVNRGRIERWQYVRRMEMQARVSAKSALGRIQKELSEERRTT